MLRRPSISLALAFLALMVQETLSQDPEKMQLKANLKDRVDKRWIYDDLETGMKIARAEKKPLLAILHCIP
ncbi:MAG: hypothetical protein ACYTHM_18560 [Planctomycetota bacterium]|jgi:hypothetical protein